jgi:hypothetical protein
LVGYGHNVIGGCLIYEIVKPIGEQKISVSSPAYYGRIFGVVIGKIIFGNADRLTKP